LADTLFIDVETDGKDPHTGRLLLVGFALNGGQVRVVEEEAFRDVMSDALADPDTVKVSHTLYDAGWFTKRGYEVAGPWHDTRVMAWCVDENSPLDLEYLLKRYCDVTMDKRLGQFAGRVYFRSKPGPEEMLWFLDQYDEWLPEVQQEFKDYCRRDVEALRSLYKELLQALDAIEGRGYWEEEEVPFTPLLMEMEKNGLPVDLEATASLADELRAQRGVSERKLRSLARLPATFNLGSPDQLCQYLFSRHFRLKDALPMDTDPLPSDAEFEVTRLGRLYIHGHWLLRGRGLAPTPPTKRKLANGEMVEGKHPSTATPDLLYKHPNDPWIRELCLTYRRADKLLTTYLEKFPRIAVEGRVYGRFNQAGTVTGRLSSSDPNLQNIPVRHEWGTRVRELFVGRFIIGDYDSLEMRLMAHFSRDKEMVRVFAEGLDPHARTAYALFGRHVGHDDVERHIGKTVNYAVGYGAGPGKLAQVLSVEGYATTLSVACDYLKAVQQFYPGFFRWAETMKIRARENGGVNTLSGRRRHLRGAFAEAATWKAMMYGERQAVNSIIQGSAADIIRRGMVAVSRVLPALRPLAQIHDEAIWEYDDVPPHSALHTIKRLMEEGHGFTLRVPLVFDPAMCHMWAEKGQETTAIEELEEESRVR